MMNSSPSSHRSPVSGAPHERGFALLTVIVIVMALTILGLSLFSLSGFEAQFFRPTLDQAQAMQSTRGGIEWARFVLQSTDSLDMVRIAARPAGVEGVVARAARFDSDTFDTADSTGAVFVDPPRAVWVRAVGSRGGQQGAVLAKFQPTAGVDLYKRLMTVMDKLVIKRDEAAGSFRRRYTTRPNSASPSRRSRALGWISRASGGIRNPRPRRTSRLTEVPSRSEQAPGRTSIARIGRRQTVAAAFGAPNSWATSARSEYVGQ